MSLMASNSSSSRRPCLPSGRISRPNGVPVLGVTDHGATGSCLSWRINIAYQTRQSGPRFASSSILVDPFEGLQFERMWASALQ